MTAAPVPAALAAEDLRKSFGALEATGGVSLALPPGRRHAVIGPNGAGKTTLFNLLSGALRPDGGRVRLGRPTSPQRGPMRAPAAASPAASSATACFRA